MKRVPAFLGRTAITGVGYTDFSRNSGVGVLTLATQACKAAAEDAGIPLGEINGIASFRYLEDSVPTQAVATALGLPSVDYLLDANMGGQAPCYLVAHAAMAIEAGLADHVLVFRALNGRSGQRVGTTGVPGAATGFRYSQGINAYSQVIAMWARRFMIATGATPEDVASVPMAQRAWSAMNPRAMRQAPLTEEEYAASPYVAEPFRIVDCTVEVDGACAVLVSSLDAAKDLRQEPVTILSAAYSAGTRPSLDMGDFLLWDDLSVNYTNSLRDDLWGRAGIGPGDVDIAELYDCFSTSPMFALEGLGLTERGGSGAFIRSGATKPGGSLPMNTNGGLLAEGYVHGMNCITEAVLQLQGRSGPRTVPDAQTCVVTSGALQDGSALVLARASSAFAPGYIAPDVDPDTKVFWDGVAQDQLILQRCGQCTRASLPLTPACPYCGAAEWSHEAAAGTGRLYSWVICHMAMHPAFKGDVPYAVGFVELDEGPRILGRLSGIEHDELAAGLPVRCEFTNAGEGARTWYFVRDDQPATDRSSSGAGR